MTAESPAVANGPIVLLIMDLVIGPISGYNRRKYEISYFRCDRYCRCSLSAVDVHSGDLSARR